MSAPGRRNLRCELFHCNRCGELSPLAILPSGGDCAYATAVKQSDGQLLLFYYSSHRHLFAAGTDGDPEHTLPADIFSVLLPNDGSTGAGDAGEPALCEFQTLQLR